MKKNRKLMGVFVACLHSLLIALPLLVLVYNVGRRAIEKNFSYDTTYVYDSNGNYQESSKTYELADLISYGFNDTLQDFGSEINYSPNQNWNELYESYKKFPFLMDNNYLGLFTLEEDLNESQTYLYAYINFYLNWIVNMSVIVFVPELLVVIIDLFRKLIYSFSHKIDGGF